MDLLRVFVFAFVVGFSGAMMPGSMLALVVAETRRHGLWAGPLVVLGHMLLEIGVVLALLAGLGQFVGAPAFLMPVSLVGAALLCAMGVQMLRSKAELRTELVPEDGPAPPRGSLARPIVGGVVSSIANPYFTTWWVTVGLAMITEATARAPNRWLAAGSFFSGHILSDLAWYTLVSVSLAGGRRLVSDRMYARLIRLAAIAVILLGLYYAHVGLRLGRVLLGG